MKKQLKLIAAATITTSFLLAACGSRVDMLDGQYEGGGQPPLGFTPPISEIDIDNDLYYFRNMGLKTEMFRNFTGTITEIRPFNQFIAEDSDAIAISPNSPGEWVEAENKFFINVQNADGQTVVFTVDENSVVLIDELEVGMTITGVYNANRPMTMIYPPHHNAVALAAGNIIVDRFDEQFFSELANAFIVINNNTEIVFQDGMAFEGDQSELAGRKLVVIYGSVDDSSPQIKSAEKVVILFEQAVHPTIDLEDGWYLGEDNHGIAAYTPGVGWMMETEDGYIMSGTPLAGLDSFGEDNGSEGIGIVTPIHILSPEEIHGFWVGMFDPENGQITVNEEAIEAPASYVNNEGFLMVPVAYIAKALDYTIVGDGADIVIGRGIIFTLGEDSYYNGRMAPMELGAAPELIDGVLFVPLNFFAWVLDYNVIVDGSIAIYS